MGDARLDQILINGQLGGSDDVVGGGEDGVHPFGDEGGDGGDHLFVGVGRPLHMFDPPAVQLLLGLGDGLGGVGLGQGVQQPHLLYVRVLGQHHVDDEAGVQRIAGAGHVVQSGEPGPLRVGNSGKHHGDFSVFGAGGGDLGGGGGDGDDDVRLIGDGLVGQLL